MHPCQFAAAHPKTKGAWADVFEDPNNLDIFSLLMTETGDALVYLDSSLEYLNCVRLAVEGISKSSSEWRQGDPLLNLKLRDIINMKEAQEAVGSLLLMASSWPEWAAPFLASVFISDSEHNWSNTNGAASSTKEMGPGARHDTLDNYCGHSNWQKVVQMGHQLLRRLKAAIPEARDQQQLFADYTAALEENHDDQIQEWTELIQQWEKEPKGPNPYQSTAKKVILTSVCQALATTDRPDTGDAEDQDSWAQFILLRFKIEEMQASLRWKDQEHEQESSAKLQESKTTILRMIRHFRADQDIYMHGISQLVPADEDGSTHTTRSPEKIRLFLPSGLSSSAREEYCPSALSSVEAQLRYAAAFDALDNLRQQLWIQTYMSRFKLRQIHGQQPNTRARAVQVSIDQKVNKAAESYCRAREAYRRLVGGGDWEAVLQELKPEDKHSLGERVLKERDQMEQNKVKATTGYGMVTRQNFQIEWLKAHARALRWREEVQLLDSEMSQTMRMTPQGPLTLFLQKA
ncbi:hypothetical protein EWM64_g5653 [Hericium alpestre]|uniref:Uncharacterized protein n=1 Tax=Hericium alpestre TaxID=135208 RepID=A0A4Y9ZUU3_9AGAM|nr:hypothetical protein EWM64_g5653 [Hericium alpestre]